MSLKKQNDRYKNLDCVECKAYCGDGYFLKISIIGNKIISSLRILEPWKTFKVNMIPANIARYFKYQQLNYINLTDADTTGHASLSFNQLQISEVPEVLGLGSGVAGTGAQFEDIVSNVAFINPSAYNANGILNPDICTNLIEATYSPTVPLEFFDKTVRREVVLEGLLLGYKKDCNC